MTSKASEAPPETSTSTGTNPIVAALLDTLPAGTVVTDPDLTSSYRHDQGPFPGRGEPLAVVTPEDTAQVATILRLATQHRVPVVPWGAGSGLAGAADAVDGCIVLSTRRLNRILDVDNLDRVAVVQPGVLTGALRDAVATAGMFYPPDPGSVDFCTIGGNVATNAGGMCCVKYGVTGDFVLGLEIVLADGRILRTGRRTRKGVAGYDLTHLFVGSEGTLGVITEITLALRPRSAVPATAVATFATLTAAGAAVEAIHRGGHQPSMLEIMDDTTLAAIDDLTHMGISHGVAAMLLLQSDSPHAAGDVAAMAQLCEQTGALDTAVTSDPDEGEALLEARRQALPALERRGGWILDDVAVPTSRIVAMIERIHALSATAGVTIGVFGHAGDGNLHPTILFDLTDPTSRRSARAAFDGILAAALDIGGTITGEHGIGTLKREWLEHEIGPVALDLHRNLKKTFDPNHILNPGKVLDQSPH